MTSYIELFPWDDGTYDLVPHFWMPEENLLRRVQQDRVPYDVWRDRGYLTATRGNIVDQDAVKQTVLQSALTYALREVAFDRWNSSKLVTELTDEWGEKTDTQEGPRMVQFGQGYASMSAPTKELERLLLSGKIRHGGHPVLAWNAANVVVATDAAENRKPVKGNRRKRIDGIVALIMAIGRAMVAPQPQSGGWLLATVPRGG
jgi:phage terminase large subunit-like protein